MGCCVSRIRAVSPGPAAGAQQCISHLLAHANPPVIPAHQDQMLISTQHQGPASPFIHPLLLQACNLRKPASAGGHPRLVRIARNSPVPQKWYKHIVYLHLSCWCIVGGSWLRTRRQLRAQALRTQECCLGSSWVSGLLVGVRWRKRRMRLCGPYGCVWRSTHSPVPGQCSSVPAWAACLRALQ